MTSWLLRKTTHPAKRSPYLPSHPAIVPLHSTTRLFPAASIAFCGSSALLTAAKYNEFDAPLIDGITYFLSAAADFARMAIKLATALGVVCAVWNSFIAL